MNWLEIWAMLQVIGTLAPFVIIGIFILLIYLGSDKE